MDDAAVSEAVDYIAIQRLQAAYADIVNRRAWDELEVIFVPDATVSIDRRAGDPLVLRGAREVGTFIGGLIERMDFFEFVILNVTMTLGVDGDADRAAARMYMCEIRHEAGTGRSTAFGVYHDHYTRTEGRWRIATRIYHSLARTGRELDVFAFPEHLAGLVAAW